MKKFYFLEESIAIEFKRRIELAGYELTQISYKYPKYTVSVWDNK